MPEPGELTDVACQDFVELVTDYLEGALAPAVRALLEAHVGGCGGCHSYLEQIRQTVRLTGTIPPEAISRATLETLLTAYRDSRRGG